MASNRRSSAGALVTFATLTRVGVKEMQKPDGSVLRVLWPPDEVFAPESLATLAGAPITIGHPERIDGLCMPVTPANWRTLTVGHVAGTPHKAGKFVQGEIHIQHDAAIDRVERGELLELSTGYAYELDPTPGVFEGEPYDVVHRNIRHHHVGLGPPGFARWGPDVRLHLDDAGVTSVNRFTKQPMEQAMRYDQANAPRSYADQVAHGKALALRYQLEAAGVEVPQSAADPWIEGLFLAYSRAGKLTPRADAHAAAYARSAAIADPFGFFTIMTADDRADAAGDAKTENARENMISRAKNAWRTPRADSDASRERRVRRPTTPAPSGTRRIPSSEYAAPDTFGGNTGDPAGDLGGAECVFDGAETRAAQDNMLQRLKDGWKKQKRDRSRRSP